MCWDRHLALPYQPLSETKACWNNCTRLLPVFLCHIQEGINWHGDHDAITEEKWLFFTQMAINHWHPGEYFPSRYESFCFLLPQTSLVFIRSSMLSKYLRALLHNVGININIMAKSNSIWQRTMRTQQKYKVQRVLWDLLQLQFRKGPTELPLL